MGDHSRQGYVFEGNAHVPGLFFCLHRLDRHIQGCAGVPGLKGSGDGVFARGIQPALPGRILLLCLLSPLKWFARRSHRRLVLGRVDELQNRLVRGAGLLVGGRDQRVKERGGRICEKILSQRFQIVGTADRVEPGGQLLGFQLPNLEAELEGCPGFLAAVDRYLHCRARRRSGGERVIRRRSIRRVGVFRCHFRVRLWRRGEFRLGLLPGGCGESQQPPQHQDRSDFHHQMGRLTKRSGGFPHSFPREEKGRTVRFQLAHIHLEE